ncbi:hypothetical protein HAX54_034518 [Datura stramonium]|uniref:DUF4378 domain-containing protein n=1 Tax=Datura stramonium TaxID=4076 RepID=A0ABS8VGB9_DATST|nr:hypothetical protein [Datura stramonium]
MAKRSQRHSLRYEKDRAAFCYPNVNSPIPSPCPTKSHHFVSAGSASSSSMQELPNPSDNRLNNEDDEGSEAVVPDPRTSVKELMEEEMVNEQSLKNQGNGTETDAEELNSQKPWHARKNSRLTRRAFPTKFWRDGLDDLDIAMEELCQIHQKNHPNSRLVKQIGSLEDAQFEEKQRPNLVSESNMSEEKRVHAKTDDVISHKQRNFFRRRSKSQEIYPPMGDETPRPSNETTEVSSGQLPRSLGRILSFPEYNSTPGCSPRKNSKDGMLPSQMREPLTNPIQGENDDKLQHVREDHVTGPSPSSQDIEIESSCSDEYPNECTKSASTNLEVPCENGNTLDENAPSTGHTSPEGDLTEEAIKTRCQGEGGILSAPIDREIQVDGDATKAVDDGSSSHGFELSFDCLKETLQAPGKLEDPDSAVDRKERPSPISVLEPLFAEDDVSPASTICRPVDPEIQPRKIHFEEPVPSISEQDCPTVCFENEESAFEYVEAVLLGSGLSWDEFLLRWLSSDQILDPSLFDEVELFSSRSCHDQAPFDCANEVLKALKEGVEWYLLQHSASFLGPACQKDMEKSGTWMDLRLDLGHIGVEMGEIILEELVDDTILSISSDTLECAEDVLPAKSEIRE